MKMTLRLGRVAGIPIGANWSALLTVGLVAAMLAGSVLPATVPGRSVALYWAVAIPSAVLFLACLLGHELAHSLVAIRRGVGVRSITLWMLGGRSELDREAPDAKSELAIAAAGPLTSFGLGLLLGLVSLATTAAGLTPVVGPRGGPCPAGSASSRRPHCGRRDASRS
jgi:Zn-dependent protease